MLHGVAKKKKKLYLLQENHNLLSDSNYNSEDTGIYMFSHSVVSDSL